MQQDCQQAMRKELNRKVIAVSICAALGIYDAIDSEQKNATGGPYIVLTDRHLKGCIMGFIVELASTVIVFVGRGKRQHIVPVVMASVVR